MRAPKPDVYVVATGLFSCSPSAIGNRLATSSNGTAASRLRESTAAAEPPPTPNRMSFLRPSAGCSEEGGPSEKAPESARGKAAKQPRSASIAAARCMPSGRLSAARSERHNHRKGPDSAHPGLRSRLASGGDGREGSANSCPLYSRSLLRWESAVVDLGFLWLQGNRRRIRGEEKGKQDKGTVSRCSTSHCLHILFSGDKRSYCEAAYLLPGRRFDTRVIVD